MLSVIVGNKYDLLVYMLFMDMVRCSCLLTDKTPSEILGAGC